MARCENYFLLKDLLKQGVHLQLARIISPLLLSNINTNQAISLSTDLLHVVLKEIGPYFDLFGKTKACEKSSILFTLQFMKIIVSIENVIHKLLKIMSARFVTCQSLKVSRLRSKCVWGRTTKQKTWREHQATRCG